MMAITKLFTLIFRNAFADGDKLKQKIFLKIS